MRRRFARVPDRVWIIVYVIPEIGSYQNKDLLEGEATTRNTMAHYFH